jgi:hypothetical protein
LAPPTLGNKVKIFVCGMSSLLSPTVTRNIECHAGPPPQVAAIAGKKDGMKQGELSGALKDLGYALDQVCPGGLCFAEARRMIDSLTGVQVLSKFRRCT